MLKHCIDPVYLPVLKVEEVGSTRRPLWGRSRVSTSSGLSSATAPLREAGPGTRPFCASRRRRACWTSGRI